MNLDFSCWLDFSHHAHALQQDNSFVIEIVRNTACIFFTLLFPFALFLF